MTKFLRYFGFVTVSLILGGGSFTLWGLPFKFISPEFHKTYLVVVSGNLTPILLMAWFIIGGFKATLIMEWDKANPMGWFTSDAYRLKVILIIPFAPFIKFNKSWYRLPEEQE